MTSIDLGVITGFFGGLLAVIFIYWLRDKRLKKRGKNKKYDERQKKVQVMAAAVSLGVYACLTIIGAILSDAGLEFFDNRFTEFIMFCIVGVIVYVIFNICNDSYYSLRDKPRKFAIEFFVVTAVFLAIAIVFTVKGLILEDGKITVLASYYLVSLMACSTSVATLIRMKINQKKEEELDAAEASEKGAE